MRRSPNRSEPTRRRWRPLVATVTTCLALLAAACGDGGGNDQIPQTGNVDTSDQTTESTESTETTETTETTEPAGITEPTDDTTLDTTTSTDGDEATFGGEQPAEGIDATVPPGGE